MSIPEPKVPFSDLALAAPRHDPAACSRIPCRRCQPQDEPSSPAIGKNPHEAQSPPAPPDRPVASIGLPKHPDPGTIADTLEAAAKALRSSGLRAIDLAALLAARGYSASTLGDGGSRGTDATSSTERHGSRYIGGTDDEGKPIPIPADSKWLNADRAYASNLRDAWRLGLSIKSTTDELLRHASDVDPTPAGTGECKGCARYCKPNGSKGDRLRQGLCQSCYRAWRRYVDNEGEQLWSDWSSRRREGFTERDDHGKVIAIHTPEPDHDLGDNPSTTSDQGDA